VELDAPIQVLPAKVEGWARAAFLHPAARRPRRVEARALLAPFDPLIWERGRTERLFGVRVRLEIYTPQALREHGYYVLPFLMGDRIAGRVDLKSDRPASVLRVQAAHAEPDAPSNLPEALAAELSAMAGWLGLERVEAAPCGELAPALQAVLAG
ncbi:MAG: YcaQ family DNA glycosylase, partial [Caulobacteraceae bacterium]|nr:YcaQ family DNA glycosylase [Caulobacter sp.]